MGDRVRSDRRADMTAKGLQADVARLCCLELPQPLVAATLAPILRRWIGCELASFARIGPDRRLLNFGMCDAPPPKGVLDIYADAERTREMERTASDDIWTFLRSGLKVQSTAGFMKDLVASPLYEQVFIPQEIHQAARVPLYEGRDPVGFVLIARAPGGRAFNDEETGRLVSLAPWLAHAMASGADKAAQPDGITADEGTVILDWRGQVLYQCHDGQRLLTMLQQSDGHNDPARITWLDGLLRRLAQDCRGVMAGQPRRPPSWQGSTSWGWFFLRAAPLRGETADPPRLVVVHIRRRIPRALGVAAALAGRNDLSPRQKDICLALAQGLNRAEIAAHLGIGVSTVITHIRELYARLGASSREDMLRIVLGQKDRT
jgi:DNA-binding CsgD family transcriptional regulator